MSKKIYKSLGDYSVDIDELLRTTGYIIRKKSNKFTIFYTKLTEEQAIILEQECTKEEAVELFTSKPENLKTPGLLEFFETTKNYKLEN